MIKKDINMSFAELLTQEQVERVHEASLEILEEVGLLVRHGPARDLFREHSCIVDSESNRVKFPRAIVEKYIKVYPPKFTFRGRDPKYDKTIPDDSPVIVTGSSAPDILDPVTGVERRSVISDIVMIAHLIQELPAYDMFSVSVLADDAPSDQFTLARLYPALKYCAKPIRITSKDLPDAKDILQLAYLVAGSEEAYREHPFITHHYCPVVSPLTMDHLSTEAVMFFAEQGLPGLSNDCPECWANVSHVISWHSGTRQRGIFSRGHAHANGTRRHAFDLCYAADSRRYADRRVCVRWDRMWNAAYGACPNGALLSCSLRRLYWSDEL
jgi:trimethylamine---corrinoid protein Co-methyltransferase